jgi:hypothetical protein
VKIFFSLIILSLISLIVSCNYFYNASTHPSINGNWESNLSVKGGSLKITLKLSDSLGYIRGTATAVGIIEGKGVNQDMLVITGKYNYPDVLIQLSALSKFDGNICTCGQSFSGNLNNLYLFGILINEKWATFFRQ